MSKKDKALFVFLGLLVIVAFIGGQIWNGQKTFSTEKWVNYEGNSRQAIVKDFLDRTVVDGLSEEELTEYLGAPDQTNGEDLVYYLGTPKGLFGDKDGEEEYLVFTFEGGKAQAVEKIHASDMKSE